MNDLPPYRGTISTKPQSDPALLNALADAFELAGADVLADQSGTGQAMEMNWNAGCHAKRLAFSFRKLAKEITNPKSKGHSTDG